MDQERDYGMEPATGGSGASGGYGQTATGPRDENMWSVLAHLSIFLNVVTGFLGPVAALVVWLMFRERSPVVAFHALQSLWYQVAWLVILTVGWTITTLLMVVIVGFLLLPVMIPLTLFPFVHAGYAAYRVSQGYDYRYFVIADLLEGGRRA